MVNPAIVKTGQKPSQMLAAQLNVDVNALIETIKSTVVPSGITNDEMFAFLLVASTYELNPIMREIFAMPKKGGGVQTIVSVDGWAKILNRQQTLDGYDFTEVNAEDGSPISKTIHIYIKGRSRPVSVTEYFSECYRDTPQWRQMPHRMLRHKVLIQGTRYAYGISGIADPTEAGDYVDGDPMAMSTVQPTSVASAVRSLPQPAPPQPPRAPTPPKRAEVRQPPPPEPKRPDDEQAEQAEQPAVVLPPSQMADPNPVLDGEPLVLTFPCDRDAFVDYVAMYKRPATMSFEDAEKFVDGYVRTRFSKPWHKLTAEEQSAAYAKFEAGQVEFK